MRLATFLSQLFTLVKEPEETPTRVVELKNSFFFFSRFLAKISEFSKLCSLRKGRNLTFVRSFAKPRHLYISCYHKIYILFLISQKRYLQKRLDDGGHKEEERNTRKKNAGLATHIRTLDSYFRHKDSVRMNALSCCSSDTIYDQQVGSLFNDYRGGPRSYANCAYAQVDDSRGSGHRDLS